MKLTTNEWLRGAGRQMKQGAVVAVLAAIWLLTQLAGAQAISTTTVQGTVYLANGQPGSGTLALSWPAFTTANGQAVAADSLTVAVGSDGFVSVNLAPNLSATPAGLYYTAVFYMSDGTTSTQYWIVPAAAQASLAQVQAQLMPAAQAVQAVSKAYVDQAISALGQGVFTLSGGTLTGPLYLNGDPTQALQAADKHYVDASVGQAVPVSGGNMTGALSTPAVNGVQSPAVGSAQTTLQAAMSAAGTNGAILIPPTYAGTDGFTNPSGVPVADLRTTGAQQSERSVKEFGAVCDGVTDDTNALQAALTYANLHGVALTIPQGTCKARTLMWHGESIGGMGKQVSALLGFPGQDVLASMTDSPNLLQHTRLHDLTIYVDQSVDVSCTPAEGRAAGGNCAMNRPLETNSIFSHGGNGLTGAMGTGAGWSVGNCAIAMPAQLGTGGNGLRLAEIENLEITTTGVDPLAAQYAGAHSTHTCGIYLGQWPQWSEFRNIDIRGLNTGIAIPALPVTAPAGLNADSNHWQNITIQATHGFTAAVGSNNVLDNVVAMAGNSAADGETPTGLVLDLAGTQQNPPQGWTVRNAVVMPTWMAVQPQLTVAAAGGAVTGVSVGSNSGLGFDPYGLQVPLAFSGSCTAAALAHVNLDGSIGTISVTQGGTGCSGTTTASINVAGNWDTAAAVNLIGGQSMTFVGGNLLKGNGGYTVWNAQSSASYGTQLNGGGGTLPGGGSYSALVANYGLGTTYAVDQFAGADFGAKLQACLNTVNAKYGGDCDARNFTGNLSMGSSLTIATGNTTVQLPCATISTANQVIVTAGTRNVALRGCALRGGSAASGSQGGTVFAYSGTGAMVRVGDPTYAVDTQGFHLDDVVINTTAAASPTAQGLVAYRTQEMDLESLYFLGNPNQTGMTLDGTGNYTGGTFYDNAFGGFQTAVNAIGHQVANGATTDWMNASTFVRLHIDCPTSGGNPIAGTYGINLQQGDGNTFTGGDVEGCATALHLGPNAQNNTIVGLRNENSTSQVVADAGSTYNNWITGGTMFTGKLTDNGTRNSFLDTFHRSFNGINGDWYLSQQDATLTNHLRLGTGAGNERGLLNEIQTDYGYRWLEGYSDATAGEQFYQVQDLLNNVYRLSIGQYNNGQASTNNQTAVNSAGTGAVLLNGSTNAGTGGVIFGSGGPSVSAVATVSNAGNAQFNGTLQVGGTSIFTGTTSVKNQADAEVDQVLQAGATASQKESLTYKDWNGVSQWYALKDASDNWALNSATGGLDSFKAYQSTNSGDTYIDAAKGTGVVRVNYESGSGTAFKVYGGSSSSLYASFSGANSIQFPGLAASNGPSCLQIDNSGYVTNTGAACGSGSGSGSAGTGTINSASTGQIAYYTSNGTVVGGMNTVPLSAGGTGSATATGALANLGGAAVINVLAYGAVGTGALGSAGSGDSANTVAIQNAINAALTVHGELYFPCGVYNVNSPLTVYGVQSLPIVGQGWSCAFIQYTGTTAVTQAMLTVAGVAPATNCTSVSCNVTTGQPSVGTGGFELKEISLIGNSNVPDDLDMLLVAAFDIKNVAVIGAGNTNIYCQSCQQGKIESPVLSSNAFWSLGGFLSNPTPNGIVFDGYSAPAVNNASNHVLVDSMIDNLAPGKALWLRASTENMFTNCQLSGNAINIQIDSGSGDTFDTCMSEGGGAGGVMNVSSGAENETFLSSASSGTLNLNGSSNHFHGGGIGTTVIGAGAHNNLLDGVLVEPNGSNITDNAPDTQYQALADVSTTEAPFNFPAWRYTPPGQLGLCSGVLYLTGSWNTNATAVNLDPAPLCGLGSSWRATFKGVWFGPGGNENVGTLLELTAASPSINFPDGAIATVSTSSGHLRISKSGTSGAVAFFGEVEFVPDASGDAADFAGNVSVLNTDSALVSETAVHGSRALVFNMGTITDGTTAGDQAGLAAMDANTYAGIHMTLGESQQIMINPCDNPDFPTNPCNVGINKTNPADGMLDVGGSINADGPIKSEGITVIPDNTEAPHGAAPHLQMSDGTGTSGNLAAYASDGSVTNGPIAPVGTIVATTDTQTLTNKTVDGVSPTTMGYLDATSSVQTQLNGKAPTLTGHTLSAPPICTTSGSANTYSCTTAPSFTPVTGDRIQVNFNVANTGASTLTVNGGAADTIYKNGGTATLASGDVQANHWVSAILDSNNHWQLEGQLGQVNATQVNGGSLPNSAKALATNSSGQPIAATIAGSGAAIATGPSSGTTAGHIVTMADTSGTHQDSGVALTAIPAADIASGTLANGMTATTQSASDNSTKLATTAYVASPGAIAPTTVTAGGIVTGGNDTARTSSTTIATTGFTTTGLVLPTVPVSTTKSGRCVVYWQMSSTSYTATFGIGMSNAPTGLWGGTSVTYAATGTSNWLAFSQTATTPTVISTAATAGATGTTYRAEIDFTVQTGATNPVAMTVYGEVSNTSATLTIEPGSACYWLP